MCLAGWGELILDRWHAIGEVQIEDAISKVHACRIRHGRCKIAIPGGREHPAIRMIDRIDHIGSQAGATHPYTGAIAVGRRAKRACLLKSLFVVSQDPTMPRAVVAVSSEANIYNTVEQQEPWPLILPLGVECQRAPRAAISGAGNRRGNNNRSPKFFRPRSYIKCVQPQEEVGAFLGLAHHIQRAARGIDDRSSCNSYLGDDIGAHGIRRNRGGSRSRAVR